MHPALGQSAIDGGAITATIDAKAKAVTVISRDANLKTILENAFRMHGGYRLAKPGTGTFTFTINPAGANAVMLKIQSGRPLVTQLEETVSGTSSVNAALRAADFAVLKTSGKPGFFAGKLAFVNETAGKQEIYTSDLVFQDVRRLTRDGSYSQHPRWSPDGGKLVYTGYYRTGFPDVFLIDLASGRRTTIAGYKGTNTGAVFSPNGRNLAMVLSSTGSPEVYVSGPEGQNAKMVTSGTQRSVESDPDWSPNGQQLVLTSDQLGGPQLFVVGVNVSRPQRPQRLPTNISGYCTEPAWNPDAKVNNIAFTAATRGSHQVALYDLTTRSSRFLTTGSGSYTQARWLNDGRHLIATREVRGQSTLCIIDSESGKITPLPSGRLTSISQPDFVYP
ncbi:MAG: biopolymer transporter Tol [Verrucomicrobiota bacterium]